MRHFVIRISTYHFGDIFQPLGLPSGSMVKNLPANAGDTSSIPGSRRCPEEGNRLPHSSVSKESACNAGDLGLIPQLGRPPGEGNGNPLQYSCLENPMDRGAWRATVHGVTKSWTRLSVHTHTHTHTHTHKHINP